MDTDNKAQPSAIPRIQAYIRISAALIVVGLVVEVISLRWAHPTAFLVFMFIGGAFMGAGMLLFLYVLVFVGDGSSA